MEVPLGKLLPPAPVPDVLLIAGEHSGDQHAARLVRAALDRRPGLKVAALGGPALEHAGAQMIFQLTDYSVVGLWEVLKNYRTFKSLFEQVVQWIARYQPKAVCFVDYPGFNLRVAKRLHDLGITRKGGGRVCSLYYIGPQIWAWKAHRRHRMAAILDKLAVIFPFEVECYRDTALSAQFVGHPFVDPLYHSPLSYSPEGSVLLLPGSRLQAVARIFPVMLQAWARLYPDYPEAHAVVVYPSVVIKEHLKAILQQFPQANQRLIFQHSSEPVPARAVLTSSGTMSLNCALAGIPGAIVYRAHPFTYWAGKLVVKIPYLGIANLLDPTHPVYPEYLQDEARPEKLAAELRACLEADHRRREADAKATQLQKILRAGTELDAATWLLESLAEDGPN